MDNKSTRSQSPQPFRESSKRAFSCTDRLISGFDRRLKATDSLAETREPRRTPAANELEATLNPEELRHAAGLMRVNHTGEICAQALYTGQAFTARSEKTRRTLCQAAAEERDHLAWCHQRLDALGTHPSLLNPGWWIGSFAIGALAGLAGDRTSLGFVEETEHQVCAHLDNHLEQLPVKDRKSRAVITAMRADEAQHAKRANDEGAERLPLLIKKIMSWQARIMTKTAYWI